MLFTGAAEVDVDIRLYTQTLLAFLMSSGVNYNGITGLR